jgi:hypothetical protein
MSVLYQKRSFHVVHRGMLPLRSRTGLSGLKNFRKHGYFLEGASIIVQSAIGCGRFSTAASGLYSTQRAIFARAPSSWTREGSSCSVKSRSHCWRLQHLECLHPTLCRRVVAGAAVSMAAVAASTAASAAVVSTEVAALVEAVFTPPDLVAAVFVVRRLAGADSGPDSETVSGPA